eukprot:Skav222112  [mRNA]  locus=scaffold1181:333141:334661:- [translate_table: standard]
MAGQLTSGGMVWEAFDEILSWGLLWFMAQVIALRILNCSAFYPSFDVALSILFLLPYLGDPVDTLKDAMLASNAIQSNSVWLRMLGIAGLSYLWILHLFILLPVQSSRLELQSSYLPVLLLKASKADSKFVHSRWVRLCALLYQQTTLTRQKAMVVEDLPQALLAIIVATSAKGGLFTVVANILIPVVRLIFAHMFHDSLAGTVKDWLLQRAGDAAASDRFAASNEWTLAMWKLQSRLSKDQLWSDEHLLEVKDMVQKHLDERERGNQIIPCSGGLLCSWLIVQFALLQLTEISEELVQQALSEMFFEASKDSLLQESFCKWSSQLSTRFGRFHGSFRFSRFGSKQCDFLGQVLSGMTAITELHLDLAYCNITTDGFSAIAASIAKVSVPGSPSGSAATCWPSCAFGLFGQKPHGTGLKKLHLDLQCNDIASAGIKDLTACLTELKELVELRLYYSGTFRDLQIHESFPLGNYPFKGCRAEQELRVAVAKAKLPHLTKSNTHIMPW